MNPQYDLAGNVIGLAMKVHRTLGAGFLESVYRNALVFELERNGFTVQIEQLIQVHYEGVIVGDFRADLIVNGDLIVELKAVEDLVKAHEVQTVNYLVATNKEIGLLLNFGSESLQYKKKFRTLDALRKSTGKKSTQE